MIHKINFVLDKDFNSYNRVLNMFCGKDFSSSEIRISERTDQKTCDLYLEIEGGEKLLEILMRKIKNFPDVYNVYFRKENEFVKEKIMFQECVS